LGQSLKNTKMIVEAKKDDLRRLLARVLQPVCIL
jgi:hypothetical protein